MFRQKTCRHRGLGRCSRSLSGGLRRRFFGRPFPKPPFEIAKHQRWGSGVGPVAVAAMDDRRAVVIWEEPTGRESVRLRGRLLSQSHRAGRVSFEVPFDLGYGRLSPGGRGVACVQGGGCLVVFDRNGEIRGRWIELD